VTKLNEVLVEVNITIVFSGMWPHSNLHWVTENKSITVSFSEQYTDMFTKCSLARVQSNQHLPLFCSEFTIFAPDVTSICSTTSSIL